MQYPDWVMEAKKSRELLSWIQDPVHSIKKFHSQLFIKCQEENCMLFYAASPWRDCLQLRKPKLCSILYLPDYSLYEADSVFYQAVGQGGLAVIDVGDDTEVANVFHTV